MKKKLLFFFISLIGYGSWGAPIIIVQQQQPTTAESRLSPNSSSDTTKSKKNKETVVTSVIDNNNNLTIKDAQVFDSDKQSGLISVTIVVRDVETNAPLTLVRLKLKDAQTGKELEAVFNSTDKSFLLKVLPGTIVGVYVTAKGYTDASANINDIKHDRNLAFELQKIKPSIVKIKVLNKVNNRPIPASVVKVKSKNTDKIQTLTLNEGYLELSYDTPDVIEIMATASGYNSESKKVEVETELKGKTYEVITKLERNAVVVPPQPVEAPLPVKKMVETKSFGAIEKGKVITLNNIYFDQSSPVLRTESSPQLDELVEILKQNPAVRVEIRGHTDNIGDFDLNVKLSRDRCQSVVDYLIQKGINASRLQTVGRGPVDAIAPNTTEANRKKNRRVEFVVL